MKLLICALIISLLSGCALNSGEVKTIQTLTLTDAQNALAAAKSGGDTDAVACYTDLVNYLSSLPTGSTTTVTGALGALEQARLLNNQVSAGIPANIHKDCAIIVIDAQETALKLGLIGGASKLSLIGGGVIKP